MSYHFSRFKYQVTLEYYYDKHHKLRIKKDCQLGLNKYN